PARVAAGDTVHVMLNASDNGNVASVTANEVALSNTGGNVWEGNITADSGLGSHTVTVVAKDEASLDSTDTSASYRTDRIVCAGNLSVRNASIVGASSSYLFRMLGRVTLVDGDSFTLDDGSGQVVSVTAPGHSIEVGDYATARGILNPNLSPPTLTGSAAHAVKLD
ncbi:MAG: hypothetical protein Q7N50_15835, partial [Armatimonadota bacterium]|nr:hypothetical protein [Armatimonadota bacterium]